jgi:D-alanine-D-alanine ligase-like ATP-grasp enzyme
MVQHKNCFELYGFDILLDESCKPWLIEINASPSLTTNSPADKELKLDLIHGVVDVVVPGEIDE